MSRERKRYGDAERREALRAWELSGESAQTFSLRTGISKSNLWRWSQRYRAEGKDSSARSLEAAAGGGFTAVRVVADTDGPPPVESPHPALMCELDGPCGLRLRVYQGADAAALELLLGAVRGGSRC